MAGSLYNAIYGGGGNATAGTLGSEAFADNTNIAFTTANGTYIATNANQKMGWWGATPVVQPSSKGELIGLSGNAATAANATNMNSNGNLGNSAYGLNDVIKAMKQAGELAM
jgi:hypothetical protein